MIILRVSDHAHLQLILDTFRNNLIGVAALGLCEADQTFVALDFPDRRTGAVVETLVNELDETVSRLRRTVS